MATSVLTRSSITSNLPKTANTVVTLFGWAAGKDAHLAKYSALYENRGYTTLRFIAPFTGGDPKKMKVKKTMKNSRDLSGLMDNMRTVLDDPDNKIVLHLLSMNGVLTLCSLMLQYPELRLLERTSGILFDSCPTYGDGSSGSLTAMSQVMDFAFYGKNPNPTLVENVMYRLWKMYRLTQVYMGLWERWFYIARGGDMRIVSEFHYLLDLPKLPKNMSFVFSDADTICRAKFITEFHETVSERGYNVDVLHLKDSKHVEHLRTHRREYEELIDRFLDSIADDKSKM